MFVSILTQWFYFDYNTPPSFTWHNWRIRNIINLSNNMWHYERVILFVPSVHSNLNSTICLIYFCTSWRWILPVTIKQDNFIFRVQVIVYQLVDMFIKAIEVVFTTICNSFYKYTIVYGFFPLRQWHLTPSSLRQHSWANVHVINLLIPTSKFGLSLRLPGYNLSYI